MNKTIIAALCAGLFFASCSQNKKQNSGNSEVNRIEVQVKTLENGDSRVEYIEISGLSDTAVQTSLNEELNTFCTWPLVDIDQPSVVSKIEYDILGDDYISVRNSFCKVYQMAAHPENGFASAVFDLKNGTNYNIPKDWVKADELLKSIKAGKFVMVSPDAEIEGSVQELIKAYEENPENVEFYFTKTGLGIYLGDRIHALGDYWLFEAKYSDIKPALTARLTGVLKL